MGMTLLAIWCMNWIDRKKPPHTPRIITDSVTIGIAKWITISSLAIRVVGTVAL